MTQDNLNQRDRSKDTQALRQQEIDKAPASKQSPGVDLPPGQSAFEAARIGQEDQSEDVGADVSAKRDRMASGMPTTAGDPDVRKDQAKVVGEEAIGGTTPTPDQDNVDEVAAAVGIDTKAEHPVRVTREMQRRDEQRYELDPESKGPASSA